MSLFEASVGLKAVALAVLLHCKSTATALHHQTLTTNPRLQAAADRKKRNTPALRKNLKITLSHAFGCIYALWDTYQQTFPVLYRWVLRVSCLGAWWGVGFARGIFFLCGMLKETEQILNLKVMFKSKAIHVKSLLWGWVHKSTINRLEWRVTHFYVSIDRHLTSDIISPFKGAGKNTFWLVRTDVMQTNMSFTGWLCISACVAGGVCMFQQALARNGGFPCNMSDWAVCHYSLLL